MMRTLSQAVFGLLLAASVFTGHAGAQFAVITHGSAPVTGCTAPSLGIDVNSGTVYACSSGKWIATAGTGTLSAAQQTAIANSVQSSQLGVAGGVATLDPTSGVVPTGQLPVSLTADANAAGALSLLNYGITCSGTSAATAIASSVAQYAAMGKTGDAQLQTALAAAGSYAKTFTGPSIEGGVSNLPQQPLRFPAGQLCSVSGTVNVPVGVPVIGNNSVLVETGTGNALNFIDIIPGATTYPNGLYGRHHDYVENLIVEGPGATVSAGDGLHFDNIADLYLSNVHAFGFQHGFYWGEVEYSYAANVWGAHNKIGLVAGVGTNYSNTTPSRGQVSLENIFVGGGFERNASVNIWLPNAIRFRFYGQSASFGGDVPIIIGPVPPPYLNVNGYTVASGGAGCTPTVTGAPSPYNSNTTFFAGSTTGLNTATLSISPLVYSDPNNTGSGAEGFAVINSSGSVVGAFGIHSGANFSVGTTATIAGCTTAPKINTTVVNLQAGETQGVGILAGGAGGSHIFDGLDMEESGFADANTSGRPSFGALFYIDASQNNNVIRDLSTGLGNSAPEYYQLVVDQGKRDLWGNVTGYAINPLTQSSCYYQTANDANAVVQDSTTDRTGQVCSGSDVPFATSAITGFFGNTLSSQEGFVGWGMSQYSAVFAGRKIGQAGFNLFTDFVDGHREYTDGTGTNSSDFGWGRGGVTLGGLTSLPIYYNGAAVSSYLALGTGDAMTTFSRTDGAGHFLTSQWGMTSNGDGTLHATHKTCALGSAVNTAGSCVADFDAGATGTIVPSIATSATDTTGTTCTIAGFIDLTINGTVRKLAYCSSASQVRAHRARHATVPRKGK